MPPRVPLSAVLTASFAVMATAQNLTPPPRPGSTQVMVSATGLSGVQPALAADVRAKRPTPNAVATADQPPRRPDLPGWPRTGFRSAAPGGPFASLVEVSRISARPLLSGARTCEATIVALNRALPVRPRL